MLEQRGFGERRPQVAEKMLRVVHTAAYLTALLGHEGQKIFWMSDHDAVCPDPDMHDRMLWLYHNVLALYTARTFGRIGGGRPFDERSTDFLDLLSAADIAAGAVAEYFTGRDAVGEQNVCVKPGAEKVLQWLGVDALGLKKMCIMIAPGENDAVLSGSVEFTPRQTAIFLPSQLCRSMVSSEPYTDQALADQNQAGADKSKGCASNLERREGWRASFERQSPSPLTIVWEIP
jgi:hypothetical protein